MIQSFYLYKSTITFTYHLHTFVHIKFIKTHTFYSSYDVIFALALAQADIQTLIQLYLLINQKLIIIKKIRCNSSSRKDVTLNFGHPGAVCRLLYRSRNTWWCWPFSQTGQNRQLRIDHGSMENQNSSSDRIQASIKSIETHGAVKRIKTWFSRKKNNFVVFIRTLRQPHHFRMDFSTPPLPKRSINPE